jgi:hypothetical protein
MTNDKFSMTNFQFRLSALVAASAALRPGVFALNFFSSRRPVCAFSGTTKQ